MNRNLSVVLDAHQSSENNIFINNIPNIVNYSCDSIFISCLEYLQETEHKKIIDILLEKIRKEGKLIIQVDNAKNIAEQFLSNSISNSQFLAFFRNKQSLVSIDLLYTYIDFQAFHVLDIDINQSTIKIIIQRSEL